MRREPDVPEEKVPVLECLDGHARISSKELAPIHPGKVAPSRTLVLQRVVANLGEKCSHAHRQVDEQPCKRSKKNDDKSAVAVLKKYDLHDRTGQPVVNHDKSHDRTWQHVVKRDTRHELNHGPVVGADHRMHDKWVASSRTWSRRSCRQSHGRAQTCRNQSNV